MRKYAAEMLYSTKVCFLWQILEICASMHLQIPRRTTGFQTTRERYDPKHCSPY